MPGVPSVDPVVIKLHGRGHALQQFMPVDVRERGALNAFMRTTLLDASREGNLVSLIAVTHSASGPPLQGDRRLFGAANATASWRLKLEQLRSLVLDRDRNATSVPR